MKGNLVSNGRCPKCTLKPPCKHYETSGALPSVLEVQPTLLKKQNSPMKTNIPPIYPLTSGQSFNNIYNKQLAPIGKPDSEALRYTSSTKYMNMQSTST